MLDFDVDFIDDLFDAWEDCPPLRRMVAGFLGIKPKEKKKRGDLAELLQMFPNGTIG